MHELISHTWWYSACWIMFYVGFGILTYILDRQYCQGIYKWFYDLTHKNPLDTPRAFVFGQKTSRKFLIATIVSTVQSLGLFFFTGFHSNPFVELVLWAVEIPAMVIGLAAGFWLFPWWEGRTKFYAAMDSLDEKIERTQDKKSEESVTAKVAPSETPISPPTAAVAPQEQFETPQERIARFTGRNS